MPRRNRKFRCEEFSVSWGFSKPVKKIIALMGEAAFGQITPATANSLTVFCSCVPTGECHHQLWQPRELVSRECMSASDPALKDSFPVHTGLPAASCDTFPPCQRKSAKCQEIYTEVQSILLAACLPSATDLHICRPLCHILFSYGTQWQADTA